MTEPIKSLKSFIANPPEKKPEEEIFYHPLHPQLKNHFNVEKGGYEEDDEKKSDEKQIKEDLHKDAPVVRGTNDHIKSVKEYSSMSHPINNFLHKNKRGEEYKAASSKFATHNIVKHVANLDAVFADKANHIGKRHTVYTGLPESPRTIIDAETKRVGKPVAHVHAHLPAYTSTSTDKEIAQNFARSVKGDKSFDRHILKISVPATHPSISMKAHSHYEDENEVLLHRGTRLKIHTTPHKVETDQWGDKTYTWHATVVGHAPDEINSKKTKPKKVENLNYTGTSFKK